MTKSILTIFLCAWASCAWAFHPGFLATATSGAATSTEDSCSSSGLLLSWHAENTDLANEDGCSVFGDTTFATGGGTPTLSTTDKSEGSTSISAVRNAYYTLDISQYGPTSQGTLWFDVLIGTADNYAEYVRVQYNADNYWGVQIIGSDGAIDFSGGGEGNNVSWSSGVRADTNITVSNGYWYRVKFQFNSAGTTKLRIDVWQLDTSTPRQTTGSAITTSTTNSITALASAPTSFRVGRPAGGVISGVTSYVDNIKVYATSDI